MKNLLKIASVFLLSLLYCLVLGFYGSSILPAHSFYHQNKSDIEYREVSFSVNDLLGCANEKEKVNTTNASVSAFTLKRHHNFIDFAFKAGDILLKSTYKKYSVFFVKAIIPLKPSDIIFPFHYFW
jgi:hypothetical protein